MLTNLLFGVFGVVLALAALATAVLGMGVWWAAQDLLRTRKLW